MDGGRLMTIVEAGLGDVEELARVEVESKTESFADDREAGDIFSPIEVDYPARLERWSKYIGRESWPQKALAERVVYKACIDGKTIGYIAGHLTTRHGKDAEIESFYVLKGSQRVGVGRALLLLLIGWARSHKASSLCVGFAPKNKYKAFYLKYGGKYINPHWIYWDDIDVLAERIREGQRAE